MKLALRSDTVKAGLSAHAAIGLLGGALLYLVCLTGTVLVLYQEFQRLEQPEAPEMTSIAPSAVQRAVETVLASEAGGPTTTHLYVHLPVPGLPRTTITTDTQAVHVEEDGNIVMPEENAWSEFLYALHYTLNLPMLVGITIVGILGVMIVALGITGVVAHPRIFRDAFRLRARNDSGVGLADWHNRLSVWSLPFSLAIALTGAIIGLATVSAFVLAETSFDGDREAVFAPLFGEEAPENDAPAPQADVEAALVDMGQRHPGMPVSYVILHDPGTVGQHIQLVGLHDERLIFGEYYAYGAQGEYMGSAGLADGEIGQQAAASVYNLHFGNYGGLPVKLAYIVLGVMLTVVCATGVHIWLGKRERRGYSEPRLKAAWSALVWGAPALLFATFLLRLGLGNGLPFASIFWSGLAAIVVVSALSATRQEGHRGPSYS